MSKTIVLVTGGNRGIGFETIKALLESAPIENSDGGSGAPYHIYLGSRDLQRGQDAAIAAAQRAAPGNTVSAVQLDITSTESVNAAVVAVKAESGRLDVLVNNVGVNLGEGEANMAAMYDINVIGPARVTEAFKPLLLTRPEGGMKMTKRIVHVTSSMGSTGSRRNPSFAYYNAQHTAYRCSKAALGMLAACQAYELRDLGVLVHAFDPGLAATEFGGSDPAKLRARGAVDPSVSGLACRDVVEGRRDAEVHLMVSIHGDTYPW